MAYIGGQGRAVGMPTYSTGLPTTTRLAGASYPATTLGARTIGTSLPTTVANPVSVARPATYVSQPTVQYAPATLSKAAAPTVMAAPGVTYQARILDESRVIRAQAVYKGSEMPRAAAPATSGDPSMFDGIAEAPPDAILSLATRFKDDKDPRKVNLGIGAYRTEEGKPWPLPSVLQAQMLVCQDPKEDKEYVPIDGKPEYKGPVQQLIFSDAEIESGRIATCQAISGTGSLAIIGQFLSNFMNCSVLNIPNPTWGNHTAIFNRAGVDVKKYTYYKPETRGFDFEGMMDSINAMDAGEAILLHACAQNPTGVDPTPEQWQAIASLVAERGLIPVIDNAYQGYASGDLDQDGFSMSLFEQMGMEYFVAQSFAKNFGLYGERIGYIHVRCADPEIAKAVLSQLKILIRQAYSSPPRHGAAIVNQVLTNPDLKAQWLAELKYMSERILQMRDMLKFAIEQKGNPQSWNHITDQIGMFSFTGLTEPQVKRMVEEFHIYMTKDGRISVAGLNPGNVDYVADCINKVTLDLP